jgi:hypothetical protein
MTCFTIALALAAVISSGQPAPESPPVPEQLRSHLRAETFVPISTVSALPDPVKTELARLLVSAGCAADHCLVHYERGGFAHVHQVIVLSRDGDRVRFAWGGVAGPLGGVHGVRDALAAGKVRGLSSGW